MARPLTHPGTPPSVSGGAKCPDAPQKALLFLFLSLDISSSSHFIPSRLSVLRAPRSLSTSQLQRDINLPSRFTFTTPLLRAVNRKRPSLCPSKTSRPSVSRFATPLLFPDPGSCPPPRGTWPIENKHWTAPPRGYSRCVGGHPYVAISTRGLMLSSASFPLGSARHFLAGGVECSQG